jgi:hypothetical protein
MEANFAKMENLVSKISEKIIRKINKVDSTVVKLNK